MEYKKQFKLNNDEYEIISHKAIANGSYGEIWIAKRLSDGSHVAIKIARNEDDDDLPCTFDFVYKAREDLKNEIKLLKKLPDAKKYHILALLDHGYVGEDPVMVLPLADKRKLSEIFKKIYQLNEKLRLSDIDESKRIQTYITELKSLYTYDELFNWIENIAIALKKLHSIKDSKGKQYVHRDIKFSNVLLLDNSAFLCDFGSTKLIQRTYTHSLMFTESWAAPELLIPEKFKKDKSGKNKPAYKFTSSADIYSLGLMIQALLSGEFLNCQRKLESIIIDPGNPPLSSCKYYATIGELKNEERFNLVKTCNLFFSKPPDPNGTFIPSSKYSLPDIEYISQKFVDFIVNLISKTPNNRLSASQVIKTIKQFKNYFNPEIKSIDIIAPENIFVNTPFNIEIHIDGNGLINNNKWLCVRANEIFADEIKCKAINRYIASFKDIQTPGTYQLTAITHISNKQISSTPIKLNVLDEPEIDIIAPEYVFVKTPFNIEIHIDGNGLVSYKWLFVRANEIFADEIKCITNNTFIASFKDIQTSGLYQLKAVIHISNKQISSNPKKLNVFDPKILWKNKKYAKALLDESIRKKQFSKIKEEANKNKKKLLFWINVLKEVQEYNNELNDVNSLYFELRNIEKKKKDDVTHLLNTIEKEAFSSEKKWNEITRTSYNIKYTFIALFSIISVFFYLNDFPTKLVKKTYSLTIQTLPKDALVNINNHSEEYYNGIKLLPGNYEVIVNKKGYSSQIKKFTISDNDIVETIELEQITAYSLYIHTHPKDTNIQLNYNEPYHDGIKLTPGRYDFVVKKNGYYPIKDYVYIKNKDVEKKIYLKKHSCHLTIKTNPSDASIEIKDYKESYYDGISLLSGDYEIIVNREGYHTLKENISILDEDVKKEITLKKILYHLSIKTFPPGAIINIENHKESYFDGILLPPGVYEIVASSVGYEKHREKIYIKDSDINKLFFLERKLEKNILPEQPLINPVTGSPWKAVVIIDKANLTSKPRSNENVLQQLDFMEIVTLYKRSEYKDYFLVKRDSGQFGWMDSSAILLNKYCMGLSYTKIPSHLKIIVIKNWRSRNGLIEQIPLRSGPGKNFSIVGNVKNLKMRYAFKIAKDNKQYKKYIFLGNDYLWNYDAPSKCLKGWINFENCIWWGNQVAVSFKKDNIQHRPPVPIFKNLKDLHEYSNSSKKESLLQKAILIEDFSLSKKTNDDVSHFPVLDIDGNYLKIALVDASINSETDNKDVSVEDIGLSKLKPFHSTGWVSRQSISGLDQLESYFFITRSQLEMLLGMLARLLSQVKENGLISIRMIQRVCEMSTGVKFRKGDEKVSEYIQRIFGIPFRELSYSLQHTPEDLEYKFSSDESFKRKFLKNLSRTYVLLTLMQNNKTGDIKWSKENNRYVPQNTSPKKWWYTRSTGEQFCWLPFKYLP